jgi:membrane fusion protein (multidrug efflux system)
MTVKRIRRFRPAILTAALVSATSAAQAQPAAGPGAPPAPSVIVETAAMQDVADRQSFTGRIQAIDKVTIRARVEGFIKQRGFEEGAEVKKDQLLFALEQEPYEAAVARAGANLASAKAAAQLAQATVDRVAPLAERGNASQAALDEARAGLSQAEAAVRAQEANLTKARLDLGYATMLSPMDGRTGRANFSIGEFVGPASNPLVTVVRQDPMYVAFPVPQRTLLQVRRDGIGADSVTVSLRLPDGSTYEHEGVIKFTEVEGNPGTDTVTVRATVPNPDGYLVDQQLINVTVMAKQADPRLLISQSGVLLDQQGAYVLAVTPENKVEARRVSLGEQRGANIIVLDGLSAGDRIIVSGHQKARPGATVDAHEAEHDLTARAR